MNRKHLAIRLVVIVLTFIIIVESIGLYIYWQKSSEEFYYQKTAEILLKSAGWEIKEEKFVGEMELDGLGEWVVSKDTDFNISGFEDNLSEHFYEELGSWSVKDKNKKIYSCSYEVIDITGKLTEAIPLIVDIVYYENQVSMARVYIDLYELVGKEIIDNNELKFDKDISWPITVDRNIINEVAEYYVVQK